MITTFKSPEEIAKACNIALKARLYVSGWRLSGCLVDARRFALVEKSYGIRRSNYTIAIKFVDGVAAALAFNDPYEEPTVMAFCAEKHRRNGYAFECVKALNVRGEFTSEIGLTCSANLWSKFKNAEVR